MGIKGSHEPPDDLNLSRSATVRLGKRQSFRVPRQRQRPGERERAVIWLPADRADAAMQACVDWCERRGYEVAAAVVDDGRPQTWRDVVRMLVSGRARVLVAAAESHLPPGRTPRTEIVGQALRLAPPPDYPPATPRRRRPRPLS